MENWVIGSRVVILIYCVVRYVQGDMDNIPLVVLLTLTYISTNMLGHIFRNKTINRCLTSVSIIILSVSAAAVDQLFILLIANDIFELVSDFTGDIKVWLAAAVIPALFRGIDLLPEYALISIFSFFVFLLASKLFDLQFLHKNTNERLREKSDELRRRLQAGNEYENQVRYLSQLEERNNLAQKIHDKVGHTIAGSIIQLEAAGMIIEKDTKKAAGIIGAVTENLKEGMESIRSTLRNIKPAPEQLGINRLKLLAEDFYLKSSINTTLQYNGSLDVVTHLQWKIIMENTNEALTNSLKYSGASKIEIKLNILNRLIKVEIRDNGKGALSIKKGMGLTGMEERTENAGGKLILDGSNGFSVITLLPAGGNENAN